MEKQPVTRYRYETIVSVRHKGLKRLYEEGGRGGVNREHLQKVRDILGAPGRRRTVADIAAPG